MPLKKQFGLVSAGTKGVVLAALLLFVSPVVQASEAGVESGDHWGQWKALSSGYVARRKEPPKIDLPAVQRRLATTQKRGMQRKMENMRGTGSFSMQDPGTSVDGLWLRTTAAGLYSVSVDDLAAGLGQSADDIRLQASENSLLLTNRDQPVNYHLDSASDSMLFVGEPYDTFYSDENAYHLSLRPMKRMKLFMETSHEEPQAFYGMETPFLDTLKFEQEPDFFFSVWATASDPDADYWFWDYLWGGYRDVVDVSLDIPNPAPDGTAQLRVVLRGATNLLSGDDHQVYAKLNNMDVGEVLSWDEFGEVVLAAEFEQALLDPSGQNSLTLHNIYPEGTHPVQWIDKIEIDYIRQPVAVNGALWMHDMEDGTQMVTGFSSNDLLVIESPGGSATIRKDISTNVDGTGGWSVSFVTAAGEDYLVVERSGIRTPVLAADYQSSLKRITNRADYLIIAPRDFSGTAEALAEYRQNRFGRVKIAWLDDIYDEFSGGRKDPAAITLFMSYVVDNWRLSPSHVILIGKGSLDEKNRMGYSDSFLPIRMTSNPWALAASDSRLLGFEDEAPFAIGRLPITNDDEGIAYVEKLVNYEYPTPSSGQGRAVLVADNPDDGGDFHVNSDQLADELLNLQGFDQVTTLYHPQSAVRDTLIQSTTWETEYVSYDGHGSITQLGAGNREKFIHSDDASLLENSVYPIFSALSCAVGDDSYPGYRSLAGALVLNPAGGAIASLAPTGLSEDEGAQLLNSSFVDALYSRRNTIGNALLEAKMQTNGSIFEFIPRIYSIVGEPALYGR